MDSFKHYEGKAKSIENNQIETLQQSIEELTNRIKSVEAINTQLMQPRASVPTPQFFSFNGIVFELLPTPKQDAMLHGQNSAGRPGVSLTVNDGTTVSTVARLEWDHVKQGYVLSVGKGVN